MEKNSKDQASGKELLGVINNLEVHDHVCLIYESKEEQFAAVVPFMRVGLEKGEKCVYVADDNTTVQVLDAMAKGGIDTDRAIKSGSLTILTKREAYLKQGYFDPDWMIQFLKEAAESAKAEGYSAFRVTGEMTWALEPDPGVERLMEYEEKLNDFFPENDVLAICQYNFKRFRHEVIIDAIRAHPHNIFRKYII